MKPFDIPKEIRTAPKLIGLEMKELVFLLIAGVLTLTFLKDMVHSFFVIPYFIVSLGVIIYFIAPASHNAKKKNYHAILIFFKRNKNHYHSLDINASKNEELYKLIQTQNEHLIKEQIVPIDELIEKNIEKEELTAKAVVQTGEESTRKVLGVKKEKNELVQSEVEIKELETLVLEDSEELEVADQKEIRSRQKDKDVKKAKSYSKARVDSRKEEGEKEAPIMSRKERHKVVKKNERGGNIKTRALVLSSLFVLVLALGVIGGSFFEWSPFSAMGTTKEEKQSEESLVEGLRSASLQKYDEAIKHFENVDYESLENDDKDVMLLSYLFADKPEVSIELEPSFDETVVSYYKATHDMEKIRELNEVVVSSALQFEVAVADNDYERIIELKSEVKMKEERHGDVVKAYLEVDDLEKAKTFVKEVSDENLLVEIEKYEEQKEKEALAKEKAEKEKKEKETKEKAKK